MKCPCNCHSHGSFLTKKGLLEAAERKAQLSFFYEMGLTPHEVRVRLDKPGSVSGLRPDETIFDDAVIEEQHRRFHNAS